MLQSVSGGQVLDVATGDGNFVKRMKENLKDFKEFVAVDLTDEEFPGDNEDSAYDKVRFTVMDAENLAFPDESFETVAISFSIHHLTDIRTVLSEMKRVLKPAGYFVVREPFRDCMNEKQRSMVLLHDWSARADSLAGLPHFKTLVRRDLVNFINELRLKNTEMHDYDCEGCEQESAEKREERNSAFEEMLALIKDCPEYEEMKVEAEKIKQRIEDVGITCHRQLVFIGRK